MRVLIFLIVVLAVAQNPNVYCQKKSDNQFNNFSRADTLRGKLTPLRTCYDITYYHLNIVIDPDKKQIKGYNDIKFRTIYDFSKVQVDLYENMNIERIILDDSLELTYYREFNAVFIAIPNELSMDSIHKIRIYYNGIPQISKRPPWHGGFIWEKDREGNHWIAVTCQGDGASIWWPNKDHQSDEPDSMLISVTIPSDLENVSNGRLRNEIDLQNGWKRFDWFVSYPINNYNVTFNVGNFVHFEDIYISKIDGDTLTLDYFVLPENEEIAKPHFDQVKGMMDAFENAFGKYPFYRDGFKLIESPHTGMEHQSAVAYGNHYLGGYGGRAPADVGLKFDFIIIHESAHEWWGNSITSNDIADMWIHESFAAYAEAIYIEYLYGYDEALKYMTGKKQSISNDRPMIGPLNVNRAGSGDMYNKGQIVLNTLRSVINNDSLWFDLLKGLHEKYKYQCIDGDDVFNYFSDRVGKDLEYFFNQYFKTTNVPQLDVFLVKKENSTIANVKWSSVVENFKMPVKVANSKNDYVFIYPTTKMQTIDLGPLPPEKFKIAEDLFYVNLNLRWTYIDPRIEQN